MGWLPSACRVARTSSLGTGFDADLRVGEDVDLVWRLVTAGHRVRYEPAVTARHDVRTTVRGWLGRKFVYGSGGAALAQRHGSKVAPAVLPPAMAAAGAALMLRRRGTVPVVVAALVLSVRSVAEAPPAAVSPGTRRRVATQLALRGLGWSVRQESALLVRHWWPAAAISSLVSPSVRRATATAIVVDSCVALASRDHDAPGPAAYLAGRRLDDLAYGAGLWWGALRCGFLAALRPRRRGAV